MKDYAKKLSRTPKKSSRKFKKKYMPVSIGWILFFFLCCALLFIGFAIFYAAEKKFNKQADAASVKTVQTSLIQPIKIAMTNQHPLSHPLPLPKPSVPDNQPKYDFYKVLPNMKMP